MKHLLFLVIIYPSIAFAQLNNVQGVLSNSFDKANNLYDLGFYSEAIKYYDEGLLVDPADQKARERIATSYMKIGDYVKSFAHYTMLFDLTAVNNIDLIRNYAEVCLSTNNLETASYWFEQASLMDENNIVYKNRLAGITNYATFFSDTALVSFSPIDLNTEDSEFGLRPFKSGIALVSSKRTDLIIQKNYLRQVESFTNLYTYKGVVQKDDSSKRLVKLKNYHSSNDGPLSQSHKFVAISRNNGKSKNNIKNTLGIYFYKVQEDELVQDSEFTFNSLLYSNTHPWLNTRGDTLFYASNMQGHYGGFDLYFSVLSDSDWSTPVNLGETINTSANELFPMIDNGVLYFSSNGHPGLGGLDNYKIALNQDEAEVINLGYPINSGFDDMSIYVIDAGFVASNRPGGEGMDDIYQFKITPAPIANVNVLVLDKLNKQPVEDAEVSFKTYTDSLSVMTGGDGTISVTVTPSNYVFRVIKEGYEHASFPAILENGEEYNKTIYIDPIIDLQVIAPDSIMFHLGKFDLKKMAEEELKLIKETMEKYAHLNLLVAAHTDSRGSKAYNQTLSDKRAEATFNYLVKLGVDPERITTAGFGETRLLNKCKDGVKCTSEEHAANRRIEFFLNVEFEEENNSELGKLENN